MDINYQDILRQLEPYKSKVFFYGMADDVISGIEKKINSKFPSYFREFLKIFGVRQDFVFGLIHREIDFVELSEFLPDNIKKKFVLVGDNGGEDFWLLNTIDESDMKIYEWEHWKEGKVIKSGFDFKMLLENSLRELTETHPASGTNDKKNWCVQFAIPTNNEDLIYQTIPIFKLQEWSLKEVSPAKVFCYETKLQTGDKIIPFTRQEYQGWETPIYYFNMKEPVNNFGKSSVIKDFDNMLKSKFSEYKLIDYGILALADEDDD
jgi:hypothetical protein